MKKIFLILFALFLIVSCGGDDPKAEAAQGSLGGSCYPNKTCDDGLVCMESRNICVKDSDGDTDTTDPTNHYPDADSGDSSDNDPSETGDENNDSSDSVSDDDPTGNDSECGNGTKETGELCEKGDYVQCSEVSSQYDSSNFATCNDYCNGWNTDKCTESQQGVQPLASFPAVDFELDYLYNGIDAYEAADNQLHELWNAALFNASITMNGGTYFIPNPQANTHWIAAYYDSSVLSFYQNSYECDDSMSCQYATPAVLFGAALSALKAGNELSIGISDENQVNMLIEDFMNDKDCVMLVGYGTLTVGSVNISAGEAGNFKFTTSEIGLYLPGVTPEGNMTNELENAGFTICK
jgi:hypothetical protein